MINTRSLQFFILISLSLHAVVLTVFSVFHSKQASKISRLFEVQYYTIQPKKTTAAATTPQEIALVKERKQNEPIDILSKKDRTMTLGDEVRGVEKSPNVIQLGRKQAPQISSFSESDKRITVPLLKSEKITNPKYLSYNDTIRQKIRQRAFNYVDNPDFKAGEVYLTFILDREGNIKEIKIIHDKTRANEYLKSVGLRSVKESSPFPAFPKDLNYAELTFNVAISFQVDGK